LDTLTADNSITDFAILAFNTGAGRQIISNPIFTANSSAGDNNIDLMYNPATLVRIANQVSAAKATSFVIRSWTIMHSVKNASNQELYLKRFRIRLRRDLPLTSYGNPGQLYNFLVNGFSDTTLAAAPYNSNVVSIPFCVGTSLYQNPELMEKAQIKFIKGYHMRPGQEIHYQKKVRKPRMFKTNMFEANNANVYTTIAMPCMVFASIPAHQWN
jgi:hypothetical protein